MRGAYRVRQFLMRLGVASRAIDHRAAREVLMGAAYALYAAMPPGDQVHALGVLKTVRVAGSSLPELEQAALLHDVGKAKSGLSFLHRTLVVLLGRFVPGSLERLARDTPGSWRYPFFVHLHHGEFGARRCEGAGCSPFVAALVRYHEANTFPRDHDLLFQEVLKALRRADEQC